MTETMRAARGLLALSGAAVVLASCASAPKPPPKLETIVVPLPPNVEAAAPSPPLPRVPITRSEAEDLWHLRSGLNVAALMCDPKAYVQLTPAYNNLLRTHKALLTSAVEKELAMFQAEGNKKWQAAYDTHMTKVYNQYSVTQRRPAFCEAAVAISGEAATATTEDLTERATSYLTRLNLAADVRTEEVVPSPVTQPTVQPVVAKPVAKPVTKPVTKKPVRR